MPIDTKSYTFTETELKLIGGLINLPHDMRMEKMQEFLSDHALGDRDWETKNC